MEFYVKTKAGSAIVCPEDREQLKHNLLTGMPPLLTPSVPPLYPIKVQSNCKPVQTLMDSFQMKGQPP
eukprot:500402-Prorocentrum_minimum.AAC.1